MSPVAETKTMRSSSFVGTLKRLFKTPKATDEGSMQDTGDTSTRYAASGDLDTSSITSGVSQFGAPSDVSSSSPYSSRRSLADRQHASGTALPTYRPVHVAQAALYHSISDPCENAQVQATLRRTNGEDNAWPTDVQKQQPQQQPTRLGRGGTAVLGSASFRLQHHRTEAALPSLHDSAIRSCSLDLQPSTNFSGPGGLEASGSRSRMQVGVPVSLPSVDSRSLPRSPGLPSSSFSPTSTLEVTNLEPNPSTPKSTLLAMCSGTPQAMRRRDWSLEDYEITRKIYKGATSAVYKGTCRRSGLPVALKVYFLSRVPSNVIHMIVREIKIHVELVHRNIVMLYAAFQDEKRLVLVQEYAARGDLYGIHRAMNRRMTEAQLTTLVLAPFMDALSYLHTRGICHRDIKPENILFTSDWRLVLADFGVSIDLNQERAVTRAGTLEYMAPEVERCPLKMLPEENKEKDSLAYTTAVDIWAVGVLAYELLVGFPPFVADNAAAAAGAGSAFLAAHATRKTLSFPASTSAPGRDFISQALAERPEERPTSMQLTRHLWLPAPQPQPQASGAATSAAANQQPPPRRSSGQLTGLVVTPLPPSRLGAVALASAASSGAVSQTSLAM